MISCFIYFFYWCVCPDGQCWTTVQCYLLICMPWRAMLDYRSMLSIDMHALTGKCFFASLCFFNWYACPDGQWFLALYAFPVDMYALTGNDFLLHYAFSVDMYALTGNCFFASLCFFCWYVCPDGQLFFASYAFSINMYALTGNGLTEFVRSSIARRAYIVGIAFKKNAHCG